MGGVGSGGWWAGKQVGVCPRVPCCAAVLSARHAAAFSMHLMRELLARCRREISLTFIAMIAIYLFSMEVGRLCVSPSCRMMDTPVHGYCLIVSSNDRLFKDPCCNLACRLSIVTTLVLPVPHASLHSFGRRAGLPYNRGFCDVSPGGLDPLLGCSPLQNFCPCFALKGMSASEVSSSSSETLVAAVAKKLAN